MVGISVNQLPASIDRIVFIFSTRNDEWGRILKWELGYAPSHQRVREHGVSDISDGKVGDVLEPVLILVRSVSPLLHTLYFCTYLFFYIQQLRH